ncbi:TPA: IS30 family transposase [Vibrio parahaemolyticus]|nr:IS30 family transposase [Vibrio parahaemolyticus]
MAHRQLNDNDRFYIEKRLCEGDSLSKIARDLGFSHTSISREVARHTPSDFKEVYCHRIASKQAKETRSKAKRGLAFSWISDETEAFIHERLSTHTSPDVISGELALKRDTKVSESTIYRYIWADRAQGGELYKDLPHSGKPYKRKLGSGTNSTIKNRVGIEERTDVADEKTELGHFEIDTIVGKGHGSYLLTVVDKASKSTCIRKMPNKKAETVIETFIDILNTTFYDFKTITSDNGTEFAGHEAIAEATGADFYFARPYRSSDRGLNEHTNGLIRRFLPKGTDFNEVSEQEVADIEHILNTRGRASLGYYSPNDVFLEYLMAA